MVVGWKGVWVANDRSDLNNAALVSFLLLLSLQHTYTHFPIFYHVSSVIVLVWVLFVCSWVVPFSSLSLFVTTVCNLPSPHPTAHTPALATAPPPLPTNSTNTNNAITTTIIKWYAKTTTNAWWMMVLVWKLCWLFGWSRMMICTRAICHSIPVITLYLLTSHLPYPSFICVHKQ